MDRFRFVLTDRAGEAFGEIQDATVRRVEIGIKKPATAGFTIRGSNALIEDLYASDRLLKVYHYLPPQNREKLVFHGPITSLEASVDDKGPLIAAVASDPSFWFSKRVVGKTGDPGYDTGQQGIVYSGQDKVTIAQELIGIAHNDGTMLLDASGEIHLSGNAAVKVIGPYVKLDEAIASLSDTADGFEWIVDPLEHTGLAIGTFHTAPQFGLGLAKPNATFEYGPGTRANIQTYTFQRSWMDMANNIYNTPQDYTTGTVLDDTNPTSITEHGLYDDAIDSGEVTNDVLRHQVSNFHLSLRAEPRNVVSFTPAVDPTESGQQVPLFNHDFEVGDTIPIRIENEGKTLIAGEVRLWKMAIEIDQNDRPIYTPTTVVEEGG